MSAGMQLRIQLAQERRVSKKRQIEEWFALRLGSRFGTDLLHRMWGTAFRTRVSDLNRDPKCPIRILNQTIPQLDGEESVYWAEMKEQVN